MRQIVVIGYGLGALGALDIARAGWNVTSVVAVDPPLDLPVVAQPQVANITQPLLIFHSGNTQEVNLTKLKKTVPHRRVRRKIKFGVWPFATAQRFDAEALNYIVKPMHLCGLYENRSKILVTKIVIDTWGYARGIAEP